MRLELFSLLILCSACNMQTRHDNNTEAKQILVNKCDESYSVDTSKLKLGDVKNLNIYNGIRYFKLGDSNNVYASCIKCLTNNSQFDTCLIESDFLFLEKKWNGTAYFFNNKLCRLELRQGEAWLTDIYENLVAIFGIPNLEKIQIVNSKLSENRYTIIANDKRKFNPYSETATEFLSLFNRTKVNNSDQESIDLLSLTEMSEEDRKNFYEGPPKKVSIRFYRQIDFECKWESTIIMQLNVNRSAKLLIGQGLDFSDKSPEKLEHGYRVEPKYETVINLYSNMEIVKEFNQQDRERKRIIDSLTREKDLLNDKKILQQF